LELFSFHYENHHFQLVSSSWTGLEQLFINGQEVSRKRSFGLGHSHDIQSPVLGCLKLDFKVQLTDKCVTYQLFKERELVMDGRTQLAHSNPIQQDNGSTDTPSVVPEPAAPKKPRGHWVSIVGLLFKLLKSAKVIKVALAGGAFAGWSLLYSWQFAFVLIGTIVFHEYGHLRAMRYAGMKTKGMYLIPFVGGVAIGERAKTQWQEVYISMMGPVFGLFMSVLFYLAYLLTENNFIGLTASISALINIFNLLPIYPLDGGHVLKAMVFSKKNRWAFIGLIAFSIASFMLFSQLGLYFLCFFIVLGVVDLAGSWHEFSTEQKISMDGYGIVISLVWYLLTVGLFLGIIALIAASALPGSEIAVMILQS